MTNNTLIPQLIDLNLTPDQMAPLMLEFLKDDPDYLRLKQSAKQKIIDGSCVDLIEFDYDKILSKSQLMAARASYLEYRMPQILRNMADLQDATDVYLGKIESDREGLRGQLKTKTHLDNASRQEQKWER